MKFLIKVFLGTAIWLLFSAGWYSVYPSVKSASNLSNQEQNIVVEPSEKFSQTNISVFSNNNEWLLLPVVFHLNQSQRWRSPDRLQAVLAETQRIFNQARIQLDISFVQTDAPTPYIDVYFVPEIRFRNRSINGISYQRRSREIYVRDNVSLRKIPDQRPQTPLPLPNYWLKSGFNTTIKVDSESAEQARTISHEIGHQLGLFHRRQLNLLEASGTTGWQLDPQEVATMRRIAINRFGNINISSEL